MVGNWFYAAIDWLALFLSPHPHPSLLAVFLFLTSNNVLDIHRLPLKRARHTKNYRQAYYLCQNGIEWLENDFISVRNQPNIIIQFLCGYTFYHRHVCVCVNVHIRLCKSWIFHFQILSYAMCMIDVIYIYLTWWCCSLIFRSVPLPDQFPLSSFTHFYVRVNFSVFEALSAFFLCAVYAFLGPFSYSD